MYWHNEIARGIIIGVIGSASIICLVVAITAFIAATPSTIERWVRKIVYSEIRGIRAESREAK